MTRWPRSCFTMCVPVGMQTLYCLWVTNCRLWLGWCIDNSNGKYSSGDCSGAKTIKVLVRFIKCNLRTEWLRLVLFHHSVLKVGEVLSKHILIERYWGLIFQTNVFTAINFCQASLWQEINKQIYSKLSLANQANHVWEARLFFHFLSSYQE